MMINLGQRERKKLYELDTGPVVVPGESREWDSDLDDDWKTWDRGGSGSDDDDDDDDDEDFKGTGKKRGPYSKGKDIVGKARATLLTPLFVPTTSQSRRRSSPSAGR